MRLTKAFILSNESKRGLRRANSDDTEITLEHSLETRKVLSPRPSTDFLLPRGSSDGMQIAVHDESSLEKSGKDLPPRPFMSLHHLMGVSMKVIHWPSSIHCAHDGTHRESDELIEDHNDCRPTLSQKFSVRNRVNNATPESVRRTFP